MELCSRCLVTLPKGRSAQLCADCEWEHAPGCNRKGCKPECGSPAWPEFPLPSPSAVGNRYTAWSAARDAKAAEKAAAKLAKERAAEKAALEAELAVLEPPPVVEPKKPEERAAEIKARLAELAS